MTHAAGLRVPGPFAGRQMLSILRETGGDGRAVTESEIVEAQKLLARMEGIWTAPEAAAAVAALIQMKDGRQVEAGTRVVMVFTGAGIKNAPPSLPAPVHLDGDEVEVLARVKQAIGAEPDHARLPPGPSTRPARRSPGSLNEGGRIMTRVTRREFLGTSGAGLGLARRIRALVAGRMRDAP